MFNLIFCLLIVTTLANPKTYIIETADTPETAAKPSVPGHGKAGHDYSDTDNDYADAANDYSNTGTESGKKAAAKNTKDKKDDSESEEEEQETHAQANNVKTSTSANKTKEFIKVLKGQDYSAMDNDDNEETFSSRDYDLVSGMNYY
jgi:hypothetical protein